MAKARMFKSPSPLTLFIVAAGLVIVAMLASSMKKAYEHFTSNDKIVVTFYYMDGCPHCVDFEPEWKKFSKQAPSLNVTTQQYEARAPETKAAGVSSFPTIKIKANGKTENYDGDRTSAALVTKVKSLSSA
jgi:hypothetical protein